MFAITAFERPRHLARLVDSILSFYPQANIMIADNGRRKATLPTGVTVLDLPFDCGLSAARHALVERLGLPYMLLLEEDFVFTPETRIERFVEILEHDAELGAIGGSVRVSGVRHDYAVDLSVFRGTLHGTVACRPIKFSAAGTPYRVCDKHNNFGLWRREMLREHSWDGLPKLGEHAPYFWRVKQAGRWRVAHTPDVVIEHDLSDRSASYIDYRHRAGRLQQQWLAASGIPAGYKQQQPLNVSALSAAGPERPNVVVLGVGHSGTSILTKMLFAAGWQRADADEEFGESVTIRELNAQAVASGAFNPAAASSALAALGEPWALKDPRFVYTLGNWLPHFAKLERPPLLVWLRRDSARVAVSYVRRGELNAEAAPRVIAARTAECRRLFELWPWARLAIDYEQIALAANLFSKDE